MPQVLLTHTPSDLTGVELLVNPPNPNPGDTITISAPTDVIS